MNFSDDELEAMEEQYQDLDPKLLQIQILMELRAIRMQLSEPQSESETETVVCDMCEQEIPKERKKEHAEKHDTPPGMVEDLYS